MWLTPSSLFRPSSLFGALPAGGVSDQCRAGHVFHPLLRRVFSSALAALAAACGTGTPLETPTQSNVSGGSSIAEARFTLRTINGGPLDGAQSPAFCPTLLRGSLVFSDWDNRAHGAVRASHDIRVLEAGVLQPAREVRWSGNYSRTGERIVLRVGADTVHVLTLAPDGQRISTSNAGCYIGQSVIVDIETRLVYERSND